MILWFLQGSSVWVSKAVRFSREFWVDTLSGSSSRSFDSMVLQVCITQHKSNIVYEGIIFGS